MEEASVGKGKLPAIFHGHKHPSSLFRKEQNNTVLSKGITRWWFQGCFIFTPKILEDFQFDWYFSDGWFNHQLDKHVGQCFVWNHFINPRKFKNQRLKRSTWTVCLYILPHDFCGQSTLWRVTTLESFPIRESSKGNLSRSWPKLWGDILVEVVTQFCPLWNIFVWRKSKMGLLKTKCWEVQRNIWKSISLELYFPAWTRLN